MSTQVQPEAPPQAIPTDAETTLLDQEEHHQDHENEEEMLRRLDAWRCMAANLADGFTQMPDAVRKDANLGISEKLVYEHLLSYMWQKEWCWPSQQRIANELHISRRTVIRACKELHARCYIDKWRRGLGRTNVYFVNPLSFVVTVTGKPLALLNLHLPDGKELLPGSPLAPFYTTLFYADDPVSLSQQIEKCQSGTSRSDTMALPEASKSHSKHTKAKPTHLNTERDSDSSGFAASSKKEEFSIPAPTYSHIAQGTIRNEKTTTTPEPSSTSRNSKPSSISLETGGAERAEAAKVSITEEKLSKWQALALAHGVSLTQQDALDSYIKNCPRPEQYPIRVQEYIKEMSQKFRDVQRLTSNYTHATKLWHYARLKGMDHEQVHDCFGEWVQAAANIPPFVDNKMAWFFKALRLEVLKALLPYEDVTAVAEEQPNDDSETDNTFAQEEQETMMPEEEAINQEQNAFSRSDEQECQEQPALEPEYLMTEDPDAGWATWASAAHWADRLRECVGNYDYGVDVLPTPAGRWGFYLYEQDKPEQVWQYMETSMVIARIEEVKKQQLHSTQRT